VNSPSLSARVLDGDPRALARAISLVEDETPRGAELVRQIFPHTGRAYLIGITGAPGSGKSTLVDRLTAEIRSKSQTVGIVAVDPTSPFSGGAILGDRVRMQAHAGDAGVFIRSMATRGHLGGLARATGEAALVLDAAGKDIVIIETVGVGQDEIDIVRTADVSVVTLVPGAGRRGSGTQGRHHGNRRRLCRQQGGSGRSRSNGRVHRGDLSLQTFAPAEWRPPIVKTEATTGRGVPDLLDAIERFRAHTAGSAGKRRRARAEYRLRELLAPALPATRRRDVLADGEFGRILDRIAAREIDPYTAVDDIMKRAL
jgi:LAO/AO transport system kinase